MMNEAITDFVYTHQIDSFQKLRIIVFLYEHTDLVKTPLELAHKLHLGDVMLVDRIITDLQYVGLLVTNEDRCCDIVAKPETRILLAQLAQVFKTPVSRQELLHLVMKPGSVVEHYRRGW